MVLPTWLSGKESTWQCRGLRRRGFDSWVGKIPRRRKWQSSPVFLPGKSYGQRSLAGYNPGGGKELDTTEYKHTHEQWVKSGMLPGKRCSLIVGTCGSCQVERTAYHGAYSMFVYAFCPAQAASFQDPQPAKPCPASKSQFTCTPSSTLQACSATLGWCFQLL